MLPHSPFPGVVAWVKGFKGKRGGGGGGGGGGEASTVLPLDCSVMSQAMAPSPSPAGVAPNGGGGEVVGEVVDADEAGGVGAARACAEEAPLSQSAKVAGADDEKSVAVLMRPHVGSRVRVVGGDGTGCLKVGEIGRVVEDDRSPIPFKVDAGNGDTSWYREDQLEHLAEYTVEDVLDQQRMVSLFADNSATAFNVSNTRFSFQASRAREATTGMLHPRTIGRNWQRAASATSQACCPWCADPRHRPLVMFVLYLCVLIPFVVGFTVSHALGYKVSDRRDSDLPTASTWGYGAMFSFDVFSVPPLRSGPDARPRATTCQSASVSVLARRPSDCNECSCEHDRRP
eukprot:COSAG02_NODE_492_length_21210_cov_13.381176_9_plen_344_part_00